MKLGMWNRLAVVATGLALLVAPLAAIMVTVSEVQEVRSRFYRDCIARAEERFNAKSPTWLEDYSRETDACFKEAHPDPDPAIPGWGFWREALGATALVCAILYGLIWLVVWIAKWVWRGREVKKIP